MLYAEEKIESLYDPESGVAKESKVAEMERKEYLELKGKAKAFSDMIRSSGWVVFKKDLEMKIAYFTEQLIYSQDEKQICRLQEATKIYRQILVIPEHVIYLANSYNQTLSDEDNQE